MAVVSLTLVSALLSLVSASISTVHAAAAEVAWPTGTEVRDLALEGTASASTVFRLQPERFAASHVNDGDLSTRWASDSPESGYPDPSREWVQVELAEAAPVHHVVIHWETAHATHYEIQVSADGQTWETAREVTAAPGGRELHELRWEDPVRFVRMQGVTPQYLSFGYSIWSFEVWNGPRPGVGLDAGDVIPVPVEQADVDAEPFELTRHTQIVARTDGARAVGRQLREDLRPATGFPLPVTGASRRDGNIELVLAPGEAPGDNARAQAEGYTLTVRPDRVRIGAATAHGLFNGIQTLRQLLPPWIYGDVLRPGPWTIDATTITDHPRMVHRGLMIDPARNFIEVDEVKAIIDDLAAVKGNVLHVHLTDDQGWRLHFDSWPRLTEVGGPMSMPGGRTGFYTKSDFAGIVEYAAQRHIEVIPEIEMPAHSSAARAAYPELGCGGGYLCPQETTWQFIDDVIGELAEISPSKYVHLGADEADMPHDLYVEFVRRAEQIVRSHGKTMIGWSPAPGVGLDPSAVHHYWQDQSREMSTAWFQPRRPVILSPTQQVYLDYPYPTYNIRRSYSWNPFDLTDGWTGAKVQQEYGLNNDDILGIEAPIWGERMLRGLPDVQYQVFPRLPAIMEKAWSPAEATTDADAVIGRMQVQGARWMFGGTNFYADPEVLWEPAVVGRVRTMRADGTVEGSVATAAFPDTAPSALSATIDWGDGTSSAGRIVGTVPTDRQLNSVVEVLGTHRYAAPGRYAGTVTLTGPDGVERVAPFTVDDGEGNLELVSAGASALSSMGHYETHVPAHMVDGDPGTFFWSHGAPGPGDFVGVDLGSVQEIETVTVSMTAANPADLDYIHRGVVEYSEDGSTWTTATTTSAQSYVTTTVADGARARYVRLRATAGQPYWAKVYEIAVEGVPGRR